MVVAGLWLAAAVTVVVTNAVTGRHDTLCLLRTLTGLPCPTCGGTRATLALAGGEWAAAFRYNPLVTVAWLCLAAWLVLRFGFRRRRPVTVPAGSRRRIWWIFGLAFVANWAYLIYAH
jgi:hypothetical protein